MFKRFNLFCDFDGTITQSDATDTLLERFALPKWREWERLWETREISSRECLLEQVKLIQANRKTIIEYAASLPVDPGIFTLASECVERHVPFTIVSDGLDVIVETVLNAHGLSPIPFYANRLVWDAEGRPNLEFPNAVTSCESGSGVCKCAIAGVMHKPSIPSVFIGDGRSDFCISGKMDFVYAKGSLKTWCVSQNIRHRSYSTLAEVAKHLFPDQVFIS